MGLYCDKGCLLEGRTFAGEELWLTGLAFYEAGLSPSTCLGACKSVAIALPGAAAEAYVANGAAALEASIVCQSKLTPLWLSLKEILEGRLTV